MRRRKAWRVYIPDYDGSDLCYASEEYIARMDTIKFLRDVFDVSDNDDLLCITITRDVESDIFLPERSVLAERMPPNLLRMVTHAYGGTGITAGYRNHYVTQTSDIDMCRLVYEWGMFSEHSIIERNDGYSLFALTSLGRDVAAGEQDLY